jgi:hypothetical protein
VKSIPVSQSESESHCDWRPVRLSILVPSPVWGSWPDTSYCLTGTVLSLGGRPLWREDGSVVCQSQSAVLGQLWVGRIIYILHVLHGTKCIYNIYKASVCPGSVQQIMPIPVFSRILSARTTHRKQPLYCCMADHTQNTCHVSDCEMIGPLAALSVARTTYKTQPHLLLRVGSCLQSCCLATR